ncbi:pyridoxamine 5-phosphate oxidase [Sphingomonas sp. AAP5]|uniref:pyridoxamine 5'-phosphate oxidase family protein n=1 Tax=Sphingomonas sp. AAP5 TaxID=1523415 RepID=UPI0010571418|nr:pyridoxamine 5'-phosphate oxidase family protein [Sphingomonas sp. AAP5]QBM75998.1 pyridoxamine 5-phosphate oxidase [Sphingomonas sp. AAP5]
MSNAFLTLATTPSVLAAQVANGSAGLYDTIGGRRPADRFGPAEVQFIAERDSFYLASVSESGWPYVQHRGGPAGFLKVLDETTLAFADFRGNRQYISLGNVAANNRVAIFLMDYPRRRRLKLYARIEARDLSTDPVLASKLDLPSYRGVPERVFLLHLAAFDWNCPQHITPRFTEAEIAAASAPLHTRLAALEAENIALRTALAEKDLPA